MEPFRAEQHNIQLIKTQLDSRDSYEKRKAPREREQKIKEVALQYQALTIEAHFERLASVLTSD